MAENENGWLATTLDASYRLDACTGFIEDDLTLPEMKISAYLFRGRALYSAGKYDEAVRDLSIVIESNVRETQALYTRGLAHLRLKTLLE